MSYVIADRVQELTATTGTGTITLAGAVTQFQSFNAGIGTGNTCDYCILGGNGIDWETGRGTITVSGTTTLSRDTVYASSNVGSQINLSGTSVVFCTITANAVAHPTRTTGISAAGSNQAGATQLTTDWNIVSTVGSGQGVALRSGSTTGLPQWVFNADATDDLLVYTKNGDSAVINTLVTTAGFTIPANSGAEFRPVSLTQWYSTS